MLPIITLPTLTIREPSKEVALDVLLSDNTQECIKKMIPTMYEADGIGLAAPQIGENIRTCVIGRSALPPKIKMQKGAIDREKDLVLVNPTWQQTSKKTEWDTEGCLSVPNVFGKVKRFRDIDVQAWNQQGETLSFEAHAFFARVIQHEVDHLNGILFVDKAKDVYTVAENQKKIFFDTLRKERENKI